MKKGVFTGMLVLLSAILFAQSERKFVRKGNDSYESKNYTESEIQYRKAVDEKPNYYDALYNIGDALYKQEKYQEAAKQFQTMLGNEDLSGDTKSKAYHNLGNALLKSKKYKESIEAYKNALKLNPQDMETKHNLTYAMKQLQKQENKNNQNQQKQQQQNKENQDQNKKNQDQKKNDQQQNNQQKKQNQNQDQKDKQNKPNPQQQKQQKQISREDAKRLLQALENDEKQLQKKLKKKKAKVKTAKTTKNW